MAQWHSSYIESVPKSYDAFLGPIFFEPNAEDLVGRLPALARGSVLELAAGTGILTRRLRDALAPDVALVSTDLNEAMLAHARLKFKEGERVTWAQADATTLPFPDASFELAVCQFGFMFFPKQAAFAECLRVLRPRGTLTFSVWDSLEHNDLARLANDAVERHFPVDPPTFYHTPYGYNDTQAIAAALESAGFEEIVHSSVDLVGESPSPRAAATGIVEGTPASLEIRDRDPAAVPAIVTALERDITERFGAGVVRLKMRALVFSARKS